MRRIYRASCNDCGWTFDCRDVRTASAHLREHFLTHPDSDLPVGGQTDRVSPLAALWRRSEAQR